MKTRTIRLAGLAALLLAGTACSSSGGTIDSTGMVCDEFAAYAKAGQPADQRSVVVTSIGEVIGNADQGVQDGYDGLANSVDAPDSTWAVASDAFAQACFDAGWDG